MADCVRVLGGRQAGASIFAEPSQSGLPRPRFRFGLIFCRGGTRNFARDRVKRVLYAMPSDGGEHEGRLSCGLLQSFAALSHRFRVDGVRFRERDDLFLLLEVASVGFEFAPHRLVVGDHVLRCRINEMQENAATFDMSEETVAESGAIVRALDQTRNVCKTKSTSPARTTPRFGCSVVKG